MKERTLLLTLQKQTNKKWEYYEQLYKLGKSGKISEKAQTINSIRKEHLNRPKKVKRLNK